MDGGGGASKNKLKDTSFIFPMTNVTILGVFCTHGHLEYSKVLEMKSTYILNILALFFVLTLAMHLLKVLSKRHPVYRRKMRVWSRKCTVSRYCK